MKEHFRDPIAIKNQKPKDKPKDGKNTPWDYRCPHYDERSSCYVNAGTHYGVGHTQPIGSEKYLKTEVIPMTKKVVNLYEEA